MSERAEWLNNAVIYHLFIPGFHDGDGDGIGDLAGIRARISHLTDLGVDAVMLSPWFGSPMVDAGYDVSDYLDINPVLGDLDQARALIRAVHEVGLKVLLDLVPNHTSDQHPWFLEALSAAAGSPARDRYLFREGRGPGGQAPPNDWTNKVSGGPAWTADPRGPEDGRQWWYLHLYSPQQPDLNWECPEVGDMFESVLRWWFDLDVDGFRVDVAHGLVKDPALPDLDGLSWPLPPDADDDAEHPHWDRMPVHAIYERWHTIASEYEPPRAFVAQAGVARPHRLAEYVRPGRLDAAFNFDFFFTAWDAEALRRRVDQAIGAMGSAGIRPLWALSSHDVARVVSRYGRKERALTGRHTIDQLVGHECDVELGRRRARAAALLTLALPGGMSIYQGDELGLFEVETLPDEAMRDSRFLHTHGMSRGRDGCRVPLPWSAARPSFGFGTDAGRAPWLPQPEAWRELCVDVQECDPTSTLRLYRQALALRRSAIPDDDACDWRDSPEGTLVFGRGPRFTCHVNLTRDPIPLPPGDVLVASDLAGGGDVLPADSAVWVISA
ncbi:MAG: alpha-amylase family glycosyl hydrolase [Knoellia sp.]